MALGTNNNNKEKNQGPTVYSDFRLYNSEGNDPSSFGATFWAGMLKLSIAPAKADASGYDYENGGSVYLSPMKCRQLLNEIEVFKKDPKSYMNAGVSAGAGLISVSNGIEFTGKFGPCLVIRKLNGDTGKVEASFSYELKREFHYTIRNFKEEDASFDKIFDENIELDTVETLLRTYFDAMSGSYAYADMYYKRFQSDREFNKLEDIAKALGVENKYSKDGNKSKGGNSLFDKKQGRTYSLDDLESDM